MFIPEDFTKVDLIFGNPAALEGDMMISLAFDAVPGPSTADDFIAAVDAGDWFTNFTSAGVTWDSLRFTVGTADPSEPITAEVPVNLIGGAGGDLIPVNTAYLVKKQTGRGGRKGRGRFYWPGVQADAVEQGGNLEIAVVADGNTALADFLVDTQTAMGGFMVLLHSLESYGPPDQVFALILERKLATQRQRLRD